MRSSSSYNTRRSLITSSKQFHNIIIHTRTARRTRVQRIQFDVVDVFVVLPPEIIMYIKLRSCLLINACIYAVWGKTISEQDKTKKKKKH